MAAAAKSIEEIVTQMRMQLAARGGEASMAVLGRAFKVADSDKSGKLSPEEFGRVLNRCGIFLPVVVRDRACPRSLRARAPALVTLTHKTRAPALR
jgi:hypothetical protein